MVGEGLVEALTVPQLAFCAGISMTLNRIDGQAHGSRTGRGATIAIASPRGEVRGSENAAPHIWFSGASSNEDRRDRR